MGVYPAYEIQKAIDIVLVVITARDIDWQKSRDALGYSLL